MALEAVTFRHPSQWLQLILSGQIDMQDAPASVQSWARFPIHQGACDVLALDTKEQRRAELQRVPPKIRPYVEAEMIRVWRLGSK